MRGKKITALVLIAIYVIVPFWGHSSSHWGAWGWLNIIFIIALWELLFKDMLGFKEFLD